jgi:hypothetical protein
MEKPSLLSSSRLPSLGEHRIAKLVCSGAHRNSAAVKELLALVSHSHPSQGSMPDAGAAHVHSGGDSAPNPARRIHKSHLAVQREWLRSMFLQQACTHFRAAQQTCLLTNVEMRGRFAQSSITVTIQKDQPGRMPTRS